MCRTRGRIRMRPDIDLTDGRFYAGEQGDPRRAYAWMRAHEPVFRDRNGFAGVAGYTAVVDVERDAGVFSNAGGIRPEYGPMPHMIDMDDPQHLQRRKLVNTGFTRKRIEARTEDIGRICDALIDAVIDRGECDFVRDLAAPLPIAVIGDMLGVPPQERETFLEWSDDMMNAQGTNATADMIDKMMAAFTAYADFTLRTIAERRAAPTEDLTSVLAHAEVDGQRMSDEEIVAETLLILVAGDETTRHVLSGGMEQLLRNPDQRDALAADPARIPAAVEEMVRWVSPVKNMCRTVTRDVDFHGTELRAGEKVMLLFEAANFDESVFDNPDQFDVTRNPNPHIAFGLGAHFCLGNQLARLEGRLMFERLLERIPAMELATDAPLPLRPASNVTGIVEMPVRW